MDLSLLYFLFYVRSGRDIMSLVEVVNGAQEAKFIGGANQITQKVYYNRILILVYMIS
jgi:monoamine oxidase